MNRYNNPYAQAVFEILFPLLGNQLTREIIGSNCKKAGVDAEALSGIHMPDMAEEIHKMLVVFIGSEAASQVSIKIKNIN